MKAFFLKAAGTAALAAALFSAAGHAPDAAAETNAGLRRPNPNQPFVVKSVATFAFPWAIAFLPDGRLLVTEKAGRLFIATQQGKKTGSHRRARGGIQRSERLSGRGRIAALRQ